MSHPDDGVLQELLDGELAPADAAAVRAHLAACAACQTALAELEAVQAEANGLIERLPLDPPLRLPLATAPARRFNPRLLGLAASAVLVAGTSWVLFRTPSLMRERVAGVPAAAPAASALSDAAPQEPAPEAEKFDARVMKSEPSAKAATPAAPPLPGAAPATALAREERASDNGMAAAAESRQAAGAAAKQEADAGLTERMLTIDGLRPDSVEVVRGRGDAPVQIRQVYLLGQVPVTLVQVRHLAELAGDTIPLKARESKKAMAAEPTAAARSRAGGVSDSTVSVQGWAGNVMLELSGNLSADSLAALMRRVR